MAARDLILVWTVVIGISIGAVIIALLLGAAMAVRTVIEAGRRERTRRAGLGALAGSFPDSTLAHIDEALERIWLEERHHRHFSR